MKQNFWEKMSQLQADQQSQLTYLRTTPHQRINTDDVKARLAVASVFGVLGVIFSLMILRIASLPLWLAGPVGICVFAFWYYVEMANAKSLQSSSDNQIQRQQQPAPPPDTFIIKAEIKNPDGSMEIAEFNADPLALNKFAKAVTIGLHKFSEKTARKAGIPQTQYNAIRDEFIKRGWADWKNPNWHRAGVVLRSKGHQWLEQTANTPLPRP